MFSLALGYSFWKVFIHALSFIMTPKEGALVMPTSRGISSQSPFPTDSSAELESFLRFEKTDFLLSAHFFSVSIWFPRTFSIPLSGHEGKRKTKARPLVPWLCESCLLHFYFTLVGRWQAGICVYPSRCAVHTARDLPEAEEKGFGGEDFPPL